MFNRLRHVVLEAVLWIAAAAGLVAIALTIGAYVFNLSLIMFRTGSMEPTIPAGSVAVVKEVTADEVRTGDVLTVDRPGKLPVTHRVTGVAPGIVPAERTITMRGDANAYDDPTEYRIMEGRLVIGHVPHLAAVMHRMNDPMVMAGMTVVVSGLVTWAFWPRTEPEKTRSEEAGRSGRRERRRARAGGGFGGLLGIVLFPLALVGGLVPGALPAAAGNDQNDAGGQQIRTETHRGEHLEITSVYVPSLQRSLAPGEPVRWDIGIRADAPEPGRIRVGLQAEGALALHVTVHACSRPWSDTPASTPVPVTEVCEGTPLRLRQGAIVDPKRHDEIEWIGAFPSDEERWLRVEVEPPVGVPAGGAVTTLRVHAHGAGDQISVAPGAHGGGEHAGPDQIGLPFTGARIFALLLLGIGLISAGVLAARFARRVPPAPSLPDISERVREVQRRGPVRRRTAIPAVVAIAGVLAVGAAHLRGNVVDSTVAAWNDNERGHAELKTDFMRSAVITECDASLITLLGTVVILFDPPVGGPAVTGYELRVYDRNGTTPRHTAVVGPEARSFRQPLSEIVLLARQSRWEVRALGPGEWTSEPSIAHLNQLLVLASCEVEP